MKINKLVFMFVLLVSITCNAAEIKVAWDANYPAPEGYRVYLRYGDAAYDYGKPVWEGDATTSHVIKVTENTLFHLVVRAYVGSMESADSEEISHMVISVPNNVTVTVLK